jgi:archaellin
LNTDFKILAKALAMRLQRVIPNIVHLDQSGYIKGRFIGDNIRTITDIIEFTSLKNMPGIIAFLDFEKAFDSISWNFLLKCLQTYNFGERFIKWVKIMYTDIESCVTNNGYSSSFFNLSRGIRQGCPLSALLFILVVETLAIKIRHSPSIKGININGRRVTLSQLADDTTLFLEDSESLKNVLELIDKFYLCSGLKLNREKTDAMWIGSLKQNKEKPLKINWTNKPIKSLGIWFSLDNNDAIEQNYKEKLKNISTLLHIWSQRDLSLKGKITVLKSIVMPQILYVASCLYVPDWVTEYVDKIFFKFLWNWKPHKIKKNVIISDIQNGGLKMPHFPSMVQALKIMRIKRIWH